MDEERDEMAAFIRAAGDADFVDLAPLPYRRVLADDERERVWTALRAAWGIGEQYWFPIDHTGRRDLAAFQAPYFARDGMPAAVRAALAARGVERVWQLREHGPSHAIGIGGLDPAYDGAEGFWCSPELDWVLYASHESSITVAGAWLLRAVHDAWPRAAEYEWTTPFF